MPRTIARRLRDIIIVYYENVRQMKIPSDLQSRSRTWKQNHPSPLPVEYMSPAPWHSTRRPFAFWTWHILWSGDSRVLAGVSISNTCSSTSIVLVWWTDKREVISKTGGRNHPWHYDATLRMWDVNTIDFFDRSERLEKIIKWILADVGLDWDFSSNYMYDNTYVVK